MTPELFLAIGVRPALALLPPKMDTAEARALIISIALQESRLTERRQRDPGTARGYTQFEKGTTQGIDGVLTHHATSALARRLCQALDVEPTRDGVYAAMEYHDVLCAGFSRLLLWTLPGGLPGPSEPWVGWDCYIDAWRPGRPRKDSWETCFRQAWTTVLGHAPTEVLTV